jgi:hypothetical protein
LKTARAPLIRLQHNKAEGKPFVINWWGLDCLFMPPKYLDDIRKASFESLSFFETLSEVRKHAVSLKRQS